jgi:3-oxoacyl-[acyl-carrier-protein] synthase II
MTQKHRVVITGIGLVTPLGNTTAENWQALCEGRSGISALEGAHAGGLSTKAYGVVRNIQSTLDALMPPSQQRKADRYSHLSIVAAHEAMKAAGLSKEFPHDRTRFGVYTGVGVGGLASVYEASEGLYTKGEKGVPLFAIIKALGSSGAGLLSIEHDLQGPMFAISNACASSADALGLAFREITDGYADYMLVIGAEAAAIPLGLAGFGNLRVLSSWQGDPRAASRPFSADRSGFVLSEGAAALILEREDLARARGADIVAEVAGYGAVADANHMTALHPEGRGSCIAIQKALNIAGISPDQIDYINAHGTATKMNDPAETNIIKKIFGSHVDPSFKDRAFISSTKSMTGHMLGGAGATEAAFCALALKHQIVPPTINLEEADPECDLDYTAHHAREKTLRYTLSNSFGFGGGNAAVILKHYS